MKIKVNTKKQTITLKGLTPTQFGVIHGLLNHVRLGDGTPASDAVSDMFDATERCYELGDIEVPPVEVEATHDDCAGGDIDVTISDPTLIVT